MGIRRAVFTIAVALATPLPAFAEDALAKALQAIEAGDPAAGAKQLQPLAEGGNPAAQLRLGMLHYLGKGVPENEREAFNWLSKSAAQGNLDAMYQLGNLFTFGNDAAKLAVDPDQEAAQWFFRAASAGHADAQYSLGLLFLAGKGVQKNDQEAMHWMQKAAQAGHQDARSFVGAPKR